jgi:DNA mismatch repair protein MutH
VKEFAWASSVFGAGLRPFSRLKNSAASRGEKDFDDCGIPVWSLLIVVERCDEVTCFVTLAVSFFGQVQS